MTSYCVLLVVLAASCGTLHGLPVGDPDQGDAWERSGKFEGDIVFQDGKEARNGLLDPVYLWPNRTIPYMFAPFSFDAAQKAAIFAAFAEYEAKTCIRFREAGPEDKDYVYLQGSVLGCYSSVGRVGGPQTLNINNVDAPGFGCFRHGTILHELLHVLGFYHQQSATDRDDYVTIVWENIIQGTENNFNKYPATVITDFGVSYDYGSVMHYGRKAFSFNGEDTIMPRDPTAVIGQRDGFSDKDIEKLARMYGCEA